MGTKSNPGKFDCYAHAGHDEPLFILLGRDRHAPALIWLWATMREIDGEDPEKVKDARDLVTQMLEYQTSSGKQAVGYAEAVLSGVLEMARVSNFAVRKLHELEDDGKIVLGTQTGPDRVRMILGQLRFEQGTAGPDPADGVGIPDPDDHDRGG